MIKSCAKEKLREGRTVMQKYLHEHFLSEGHDCLINDAEIVRILEN